jgi:uncharacterized glyoxalase superfamily metalloenzyme YdcJ
MTKDYQVSRLYALNLLLRRNSEQMRHLALWSVQLAERQAHTYQLLVAANDSGGGVSAEVDSRIAAEKLELAALQSRAAQNDRKYRLLTRVLFRIAPQHVIAGMRPS